MKTLALVAVGLIAQGAQLGALPDAGPATPPRHAQTTAARPTEPAWRTKPSWYLVAMDDRMIPPPAQRAMASRAGAAVTETGGSHAPTCPMQIIANTIQIDGRARDESSGRQEQPETQKPDS